MKYLYIPIIITGLFLILSCEKDPKKVSYHESGGVFILNEGNYTYGNASLSFYNPESKVVSNNIFYEANGFPIGDVLQSMTFMDSLAYLVVNNSGKILVMNRYTFQYKGAITGLVSPRKMLILNDEKAYVSDLYSNKITIINPETFTITGYINLGKTSEDMVQYNDYVFVTSWSKQKTVLRINAGTDLLVDSLVVAKQPNSLVIDKNKKLWVLSDGGVEGLAGGKVNPALVRINPDNFTIEKEFVFDSNAYSPTHLSINSTGDTLYYLNSSWGSSVVNGGVYRQSIAENSLSASPFIPEGSRLFYGLGIDPVKNEVYVSDAVDYLQSGWVYRFSAGGAALDSFKTDIIPSSFCFQYE